MIKKKTILVAALNWGIGHATRCIPIINALLKDNFNVIIASDGAALVLLQKEFSALDSVNLPSYQISYPKNGIFFKWKLLLNVPTIKKAISSEKKIITQLVNEGKIDGIISDNRLGVRSKKIPSIYITHQIKVFSGFTTFFSSKLHQHSIKKFDECWVPDLEGETNFSGELGHIKSSKIKIKYLGILSRMKKQTFPIKYDVLLLLSGPEPQRTLFEELLIKEFKGTQLSVLLVQGCVEEKQIKSQLENITCINFMKSTALEKAINESAIVVSRSGYSTLMDLAVLGKKAFFIPTPGQYEQEYLAYRMKKLKMAPYCKQKGFTLDKIKEIENYSGVFSEENSTDFSVLFSLFKGK